MNQVYRMIWKQIALVGGYVIKDYEMVRKTIEYCSMITDVEGDCPLVDQHD